MKTIRQLNLEAAAASVQTTLACQVTNRRDDFTADGKPYLELTVADATGTEKIKLWSDSGAFADCKRLGIQSGSFIRLAATWSRNKYGLNVKSPAIDELAPLEVQELLAGDEESRSRNEQEWKELMLSVDALEPKLLSKFALSVLKKYEPSFRRAAAARGNHHARRGGLLSHVVSMVRVAEMVSSCYPEINRALLVVGIILHDLAKVFENDYDPRGFDQKPTYEGTMLGHIPLGADIAGRMWDEFAKMERVNLPQLRTQIIHLVLCHHGQLEWGSPIEPKTPEGFAIHYIDNLDARIEILRESYANPDTIPGICDAKKPLYHGVARPWNDSDEAADVQWSQALRAAFLQDDAGEVEQKNFIAKLNEAGCNVPEFMPMKMESLRLVVKALREIPDSLGLHAEQIESLKMELF